jgi:hypothetical protein
MSIAVLGLLGTGLSAAGSIGRGIAQAQSASYQAQVAANNATIERQNAVRSAQAASAQTEAAGMKEAAKFADIRAGLAANNVDVNDGSASDVQSSQRQIGALDEATVSSNAALTTYGYQTQAVNEQAQSEADQAQVGSDIVGGVLKGGGAALGNADVDSGLSSLISGPPSVPPEYQWMQNTDDAGIGY